MKVTLFGLEPCAKARPRVTKTHTYMPPAYRVWQDKFCQLWHNCVPRVPPFEERVCIKILWTTPTGLMKPDEDNSEAAVWDALVKVGILKDDSSKYVGEGAHRIQVGPLATRIVITPYVISAAPWPVE